MQHRHVRHDHSAIAHRKRAPPLRERAFRRKNICRTSLHAFDVMRLFSNMLSFEGAGGRGGGSAKIAV
jgi:hypothetical protein